MKRALALFIAIFMLFGLSACGETEKEEETVKTDINGVPESTKGRDVTRAKAADNVFSLNCNTDYSFNPLIATNHSNQLVCDLVYENMIELDGNFEVIPNVLENWYPNDNATYWTFKIGEGHFFHDGTPLTGKDIRYSLDRAITSDRYKGRFRSYQGSGYDENYFYVTLGVGDTQFVKLLDIPIIKYGSTEEKYPLGSGPYTYNEDYTELHAVEDYELYKDLPIDTIHLVNYSTADSIISAFEDGIIDCVTNDPSSYTNLGYASTNEMHNFNTTNYHYIMFNQESTLGQFSGLRLALEYAFDRANFQNTLTRGNGIAATLPMHPNCRDYPKTYADSLNYNLKTVKTVLENAGIKDYNDDGWLEYMSGSPQKIDINFIVCSDSSVKSGVAHKFQSDMESIGLRVTVNELTWQNYLTALEEGEFDMYYGEIKLRNNFDISELLDVDSSLNYSRIRDTAYTTLVNNYLMSPDATRSAVFQQLCQYIDGAGTLISIGFESQQIIVHRGTIKGMDPNAGNPLYGFPDWEIMLD